MKRTCRIGLGVVVQVTAILTLMIGSATAQQTTSRANKNQTISIVFGRVSAIEDAKLDTAAGGGAVVGGMVGLATQHGKHGRDQVAGAAAGALLGAVLTRTAEGTRKAQAYTVQENNGATVKIIQDMADIRVGDCVAVEQGSTSNVRRVAAEMCDRGPHLSDSTIVASHQQDADECVQAKQQVLNAKTDAEFVRAEKKVQILCH